MNGREWTDYENEFLKRFYPTNNTADVAWALTRSKSSVYGRAKELQIKKIDARTLIVYSESEAPVVPPSIPEHDYLNKKSKRRSSYIPRCVTDPVKYKNFWKTIK